MGGLGSYKMLKPRDRESVRVSKKSFKALEAAESSEEVDAMVSSAGNSGKGAKRRTKEAAIQLLDLMPEHDGNGSDCAETSESASKQRKRKEIPSPSEEVCDWVTRLLEFVHKNGLDLLAQVCGRYRLAYDGDFRTIAPSMQEQVAHCVLFNPALYKNASGMPVSLRECKGVTNFRQAFLQDPDSVVRHIRISCNLAGEPFSIKLRACSNCGSCFSGRFMDAGAHQRAGGWKEITERITAGKHSWVELKGWR